MKLDFQAITNVLQQGGVIAYPTEAVYGLGCDPFNEPAVNKLLAIKQRTVDKGLILLAADFSQISHLIIPTKNLTAIQKTWPGPNTWVFPASPLVPNWITGQYSTVAVRITDHPIAREICLSLGTAIVSTSANLAGDVPAKNWRELPIDLIRQLDYLVKAEVGARSKPSMIRDAETGKVLRA